MPTACSDADLEDDDAMFEEYASSAASMQLARGGTMQDSSMSSAVVAFLEKRFGSVSHFYTDTTQAKAGINGFDRLESLRRALNALDRGGWERSYHQRVFHESFINAVVRVLFKTDPPGFFSQSYPRILELNTWTSIHQEILISTPRRFGKTISVCLFVAALVFACPRIEISIYSTCEPPPSACEVRAGCAARPHRVPVRADECTASRQAHQLQAAAQLRAIPVHHPRRAQGPADGISQAGP